MLKEQHAPGQRGQVVGLGLVRFMCALGNRAARYYNAPLDNAREATVQLVKITRTAQALRIIVMRKVAAVTLCRYM